MLAAEGPDAVRVFRAQRAQPPQVQRGPAQLLEYTAATLEKSLAAFRSGEHEQAYDLSVAAYLEASSWWKAPWTTSMPTCARTPRKP